MAKEKGRTVVSVGIDYGQRHHVEMDYAASQCERFGIERRILRVNWDKPKRSLPLNRKVSAIGRTISPAFLPARNGIFLLLACAEAAGLGAAEVWVGVNSVNFSGYPDCKPEFIAAFKKMLRIGVPNGPRIIAPLQLKSKIQIAAIAHRLGLTATDTWSCYRPQINSGGVTPCGRCDACVLHDHAWKSLRS